VGCYLNQRLCGIEATADTHSHVYLVPFIKLPRLWQSHRQAVSCRTAPGSPTHL